MRAFMTLWGLLEVRPEIWTQFQLPSKIDSDTLKDLILTECGNLEVLYPAPHYFGNHLYHWSLTKKPIWEKLIATTEYEYNPIHNYDRTEEHSYSDTRWKKSDGEGSLNRGVDVTGKDTEDYTEDVNEQGTTKRDLSASGKEVKHSDSEGNTNDSRTGTVEETVSAFNSEDYVPSKKTTSEEAYESKATGTVDTTTDTTNNEEEDGSHHSDTLKTGDRTLNKTENTTQKDATTQTEEENETFSHDEHIRAYGNIGVTTTQQMIEAEREVVQFDIYEFIAEQFKHEFCILVY